MSDVQVQVVCNGSVVDEWVGEPPGVGDALEVERDEYGVPPLSRMSYTVTGRRWVRTHESIETAAGTHSLTYTRCVLTVEVR